MNSKYCPDTHTLVWYFQGKKTLSSKARHCIQQGFAQTATLIIPTTVILEAFHISLKQPKFVFPKFLESLQQALHRIVAFDKSILNICYRLPKEINIHDRVIAATALAYNCPLITKDKILSQQTAVKTIW